MVDGGDEGSVDCVAGTGEEESEEVSRETIMTLVILYRILVYPMYAPPVHPLFTLNSSSFPSFTELPQIQLFPLVAFPTRHPIRSGHARPSIPRNGICTLRRHHRPAPRWRPLLGTPLTFLPSSIIHPPPRRRSTGRTFRQPRGSRDPQGHHPRVRGIRSSSCDGVARASVHPEWGYRAAAGIPGELRHDDAVFGVV